MGETKVNILDIARDLDLEIINYPQDNEEHFVATPELNRPGLQYAGFFEYFTYDRIQVIGRGEYEYFAQMDDNIRKERLEKLFSYKIPAVIVSRNMEIKQDFLEAAEKHDTIVLRSKRNTTRLINKLSNYLENRMAKYETIHGVLVDIYGVGVLIKGESSVGKSETALELVQKGHRLVADDAVEIRKTDENRIIGQAPELLRHFMEIRGVGILDIKSLYGVRAVKQKHEIGLVVYLESWDSKKYYDRLGLDREYETIMGVQIEKMTVPVKPGRNTSMILEVAAMNYRQKGMGYDAAEEFTKKLNQLIHNDR
ncbi:HPr kinase/phosphorylase [Peptacetobacter hominis]|uniref:HPr kinase/phosphorylase n=1 Tax=Peptacetobacter hominis TaxID=2743610 RepID=A0A544QTP4_9FIRM|nr:HPr(Ser) kinase/phosphatase [Peptacetobacter hominis]TQQ84058.1 HPr kinase/phosphorylase [Peptacetobacter hominis]